MNIQSRSFEIAADEATKLAVSQNIRSFVKDVVGNNMDALLLVTEASANCLLHSQGTHFTVTIANDAHGNHIIEVVDDGSGYDFRPLLEKAQKGETVSWKSDHGRGIFLINDYCGGNMVIADSGRLIRFVINRS